MITRQFVTIQDSEGHSRQVHYQMAGSGPSLVLLHQAPLSSCEMKPLLEKWSKEFTCIAPDHPGFGLSDPFDHDTVSIQDLATALLEVLDALGIEQTAVYGIHTGACIAVALTATAPNRVWACVANGYVMVTPEEREDLLTNYLPKLNLSADGSHLSWLWWRVREKLNFGPWYRPNANNRITTVKPDLAELNNVAIEMLRSNDQYRTGYRAAFTFDGQALLDSINTPTLAIVAKQDSLAGHLQRIKNPSSYLQLQLSPDPQQAELDSFNFIKTHAKKQKAIEIKPTRKTISQRLSNHMTPDSGQQLRLQLNLDAPGKPVLLLHDSIGSADVLSEISESFIGVRPIICMDLPGHGESDGNAISDDNSLSECLASILTVLNDLDMPEVDCVGLGSGGHIGLELQKLNPTRITKLAMIEPDCLPREEKIKHLAAENANWQPRWDGTHLMELWYRMRDEALVWPWFQPDKGDPICQSPWLQNSKIQKRVLAFLKAPKMTLQSMQYHAHYSMVDAFSNCNNHQLLCCAEWSPNYDRVQSMAKQFSNSAFLKLPENPQQWGEALAGAFDTDYSENDVV